MDQCEMCSEPNGEWHLFDESAEMMLCRKCARQLRAIGETVERIEA